MNLIQTRSIAKLPQVLLPWYREYARRLPWRETKDPYAVWLSEIMLQQTRVEAVKKYYIRFIEHLPTVSHLANAPEPFLLKLWEGLGYYSRARNMQKAAKIILETYSGIFPKHYQDIIALPGIGEYTAGAISSICFGMPTPAVDGNVLRVISRICNIPEPITSPSFKKEVQHALSKNYPKDNPGDFTQALMELGATICVPNGTPLCETCPASVFCIAKKNHLQNQLPLKPEKKVRRKETLTVFLLTCGKYVAISKRPETGLLRGMWEFPNTPGALIKSEAVRHLGTLNVTPKDILSSVSRKHIFTHVEWNMTGYRFTCENMPDSLTWVTKEQLTKDFALPTAFRQFIECI